MCHPVGYCCGNTFTACADDAECCPGGHCELGACCRVVGIVCAVDAECCSGKCGSDGGCQYVDAGSTWDGGPL